MKNFHSFFAAPLCEVDVDAHEEEEEEWEVTH